MRYRVSRRWTLGALGAGIAGLAARGAMGQAAGGSPCLKPGEAPAPRWGRGYDGQRIADLGDGRFLNPVFAGDHPDPSILRDGDVYYLTFSSFDAYPGLMIWRSYDLVNWEPVGPALTTPIGSVWAPDLIRHGDRYFLYIPARTADYKSIYAVSSVSIEGPWSEPVDLELPDHIDPGHIVGEDGRRYLFLSNGDMVPLTEDGLNTDGPVEHVYNPWHYPEDWDVECFCPEGPKMLKRGDWFYMLTAVGGTAGLPTGHMVIAARAPSVRGPWEHAPNNPQVRTRSRRERWWSRGHATLFEGPGGGWWLISHGYENGYRTLGRQCLLQPARWREDGWFEALGGDLSRPLAKPGGGKAVAHGWPLSDDFEGNALGPQWAFYRPGDDEYARVTVRDDTLHLRAKGAEPRDASPLCFVCGDHAYTVDVEIERDAGARGGLLLFYNDRLYCGLGFDDAGLMMHRYGLERRVRGRAGKRLFLRVGNDRHIVTIYTGRDGHDWEKFDVQMETSGYHHNVAYDFLSLRPAIYASGEGEVRFRHLRYRAL
ncbi:MAG TPA: family 43 glycosylhydrolase [Woeseiaceae bacterium]|nr:family 43 glycosylhydrolase [Woeseiaceae bacterium]